MANIALVDDHVLMRKGLANLLQDLEHQVLFEADNGKDFLDKLKDHTSPELVLMDINMPQMDGYETALEIKQSYPDIRVLALSMYDDELAIIKMLRNGARGYVLKDCEPKELKAAIKAVLEKGFYYSELVSGYLIRTINNPDDISRLSTREIEFLKLCCTEMTYKEIADKMCLSPRTVDGYRDELFRKLCIKSRVGLVMFAIKNGIVKV
jgi:DNA-binding NarL/FixJ family response regulator